MASRHFEQTVVTQSDIEEKRASLLRLKLPKLKAKCKEHRLSQEGGKMDLINRIIDRLYVVPQNDPTSTAHDNETWDQDHTLKLSDDEEEADEKQPQSVEVEQPQQPIVSRTRALSVPVSQLKTKGSVVDMLMMGPFGGGASRNAKNAKRRQSDEKVMQQPKPFKQRTVPIGNSTKFTYKKGKVSEMQTLEKMHATLKEARTRALKLDKCVGFSIESKKKPGENKEYLVHFKEGPSNVQELGTWHSYLC